MPDESIAHENHHRARAQREEGLRARLRERGKTTGQTPFGLLGLANLDTRHKHQSESVWCEGHHVRNPVAIRGHTDTQSMVLQRMQLSLTTKVSSALQTPLSAQL
jgi:hypothetical protein